MSLQPNLVRALIRELKLLGAIPVFADVDDAVVLDTDRDAMPAFFDMFLDEWTGPDHTNWGADIKGKPVD